MEYETLRKHHVSRTNVLKTVAYRGYEVPDGLDLSLDEFAELYEEADIVTLKTSMSDGMTFYKGHKRIKLIVVWISEVKLGNAVVRSIVDTLESEECTNCIVIADGGVTPQSKGILRSLRLTDKIIIDYWTLKESLIFVPDHILVPEHRILPIRERKALYVSYGLQPKSTKIPWICRTDIMVMYLGVTKGQVIEIKRKSETDPSKFMLSYRVVV